MISVDVTGGLKKDRVLAEDIVWSMITVLMPRIRNLEVEVRFCKTMEDGAQGWCTVGDDTRHLILEIDHRLSRLVSKEEFIETIIHEMVHVWQWATGRIIERWRGGYRNLWKCEDGKYRNFMNKKYMDQPWEIEAYKLQGPLTKAYMEVKGIK